MGIEIHRELGEISSTLKSIEKKLDGQTERLNNHSTRLRGIEGRQHWYAGAATIVGFAGAYLFNLVKGFRL